VRYTRAVLSILALYCAAMGAQAALPVSPRFTLAPPTTGPILPVVRYALVCAPGLNSTADWPNLQTIEGNFTDNPHTTTKLANGPWTCFVNVVTSEGPPAAYTSTNRVSFTVGPPVVPLPPQPFTLTVD